MVDVQFFYPRWGAEHVPWIDFLNRVSEEGYHGMEWYPFAEKEANNYPIIFQAMADRGLQFSIVFAVFGETPSFEAYLIALEEQLFEMAFLGQYGIAPQFISAQVGREYFSQEQILTCLAICSKVEQMSGIPIYQETHRNKWTYGVHRIPAIKMAFPELKLTLDISHWYCVSESYLEDQQDLVLDLLPHVHHVHTRVGHTQGSQIPDVTLESNAWIVGKHLEVWQQYVNLQLTNGRSKFTFTTEFGPPPYLISSGNLEQDYEEQWRQNKWIKNYLMNHLIFNIS
ncbi:sugar phosphate isomerase/epimerase [Sphingobacterium sp. HJSM2_6]|uniref:sugar phosphate isomerase/epimerase n=1 Tax=Sphingobacterium sp. HJSM2_6 TaxID=3366264 RepID=UPI003BCD0782